jgi:uncharacterized protein YfaP (DUF2135 family)
MTTNHILAPWTKTQTERGSVVFANDGEPIYTPERTPEQCEAMAQLIADAPELLELCQELLGPMIVWSQYWGNAYNGGKSSPAHKEIIQRASIVIARNTHEDAE